MSEIKFWRAVVSLMMLGALLSLIFYVWSVIIPFFLGISIAYLVYPLVDRFTAMGLKQSRVVVILYILLLAVGGMSLVYLYPLLIRETNAVVKDFPNYVATINGVINQVNAELQRFLGFFIGERAEGISIPFEAEKFMDSLILDLPSKIIGVAHWGLWIFIIPFVSFFALSEGKKWIDTIFEWTPSQYVESLLGFFAEVNATLGGYIRGALLDAICVAILTMIGLHLLGIEGAVLLGCITGVLNLVPFLAPIVGGGLALMAGIIQQQSAPVLMGIFVLYVLVRMFDDFVFIPFVIGNSVRLHPVFVLFAILAGYELGGFLGLLFAIPLAAVIKVSFSIFIKDRQSRILHSISNVYS